MALARPILVPAFAVVVLFIGTGSVSAQKKRQPVLIEDRPAKSMEPPSRRLGVGEDDLEDVRPFLGGLLDDADSKGGLDPSLLAELLKKMPKGGGADAGQFEKMFKDNPQFKDPAFLRQLQKMLDSPDFMNKLKGAFPQGEAFPKVDDQDFANKMGEFLKKGQEVGPRPEMKPPNFNPMDGNRPPVPDPANPQPEAQNEWAKWLEKNFGDSPAAQEAVKDLMAAFENPDMKGLFDQYPEFKNGDWKDMMNWGKENTGDLWKMKPPDWGGANINPNMGGGGGPNFGGGSSGGLSFGGGGGGVSGEGIGSVVAVIAGVIGAIFIVAMLMRKWKIERELRLAAALAGRGPLDLSAIRSREELVRAFDTVSLLQCGEEARAWNHKVIAGQIGETVPAHADPAQEVAGLYEKARYAPPVEDLSAGELSIARHDLCTIAGVTP